MKQVERIYKIKESEQIFETFIKITTDNITTNLLGTYNNATVVVKKFDIVRALKQFQVKEFKQFTEEYYEENL